MKLFHIIMASSVSYALSFSPTPTISMSNNNAKTKLHLGDPNPPNWGSYNQGQAQSQQPDSNSGEEEGKESLKGNRFSQFAPDASLPTDEFRNQLKENMKADLERRRREDPNRGNQPAKSYLDSL